MKKEFANRLLRNRFQSTSNLRRIFDAEKFEKRRQQRLNPGSPSFVKGVIKGQYVRIKVPGPPEPRKVPRLHNPANPPLKPFSQPESATSSASSSSSHSSSSALSTSEPTSIFQEFREASAAGERKEFFREYWDKAKAWVKYNFAVLVLNIGSVMTLIGFTRSDVLELRLLSVAGSTSYIVYFLALPGPRDWTPILWSLTFVLVNGQKIYEILVERKAPVTLKKNEEEIYKNYFKPHGITLKQFEYIFQKARIIHLKKGDALIREGDIFNDVFLVTSGTTRAHHLGRRLTAASYAPQARKGQSGGASGAWVGEMAFFQQNWNKDKPTDDDSAADADPDPDDSNNVDKSSSDRAEAGLKIPNAIVRKEPAAERAMYTIVALEDDTTVLAWTHSDMQALLDRSVDLSAALTRAMTAAIVGKVVNFTASKKANNSEKTMWWLRLWPLHHGMEDRRVVESKETAKVKVDEKPVYALPDAKD